MWLAERQTGTSRFVHCDAFGTIDAWINNAGADILTGDASALSDVEKMDLLLDVDLRGTILASWRAAEILSGQAGGGVIINISWDHVLAGMAGTNPQLFAAAIGGVLLVRHLFKSAPSSAEKV